VPKFFIQLGHHVENHRDHAFYPHVYGPYENDIALKAAMARRWPNDKEARFIVFEGEICGVPPSSLEKPEDQKRAPGDESKWTKSPEGSWHCNDCGALIQAAQIAHPVHDGPFPLSGSGSCEYETVGYCPNCERKPGFHGAPVGG
jgi:hypothetical protein